MNSLFSVLVLGVSKGVRVDKLFVFCSSFGGK